MACKYSDRTDIEIGDKVSYETIEMEEGRGYGIYRTTKIAKVREIKVIMDNGDSISPNRLTKVEPVARASGEGSARKSRKSRKTRKQRRNH